MQKISNLIRKSRIVCILLLTFLFIFPISINAADKKKFVVVIDAGHGGSDTGAIENGVREKDINLQVALKLGALINKKLKDTEVIYTRDNDRFISLQNRADIANKAKADLFISIHCNSVDRSNKNRANVLGATTYVLGHHKDSANLEVARRENAVVELDSDDSSHYAQFNPDDTESNIIFQMTQKKNFQNSVRFASDVQKEMAAAGRYSRGVQQAGFWVLWSTAMPAALIELDFICNPAQASYLSSKEGQDKLAGAIFNAVKNYESYFRKNLGTTASSDTSKEKKEVSGNASQKEEDMPVAVNEENGSDLMAYTDNIEASGGIVEIPSSTQSTRKKHTASGTVVAKKNPTGSHRRRSSSARQSKVEEAVIAVSEEYVAPPVGGAERAAVTSGKNTSEKNTSVASKKTKQKNAAPGRRDKDGAKKKAVRKGVNVSYKVLLFVTDEELKANDESFQGLAPVYSFRENNQYKYTYGESENRQEMESLLLKISSNFPDARVIKCYY